MKEQEVRLTILREGSAICFNCARTATQRVICGKIYQDCCDDPECVSASSSLVYDAYPSDFRSPPGFQIIRPENQVNDDSSAE